MLLATNPNEYGPRGPPLLLAAHRPCSSCPPAEPLLPAPFRLASWLLRLQLLVLKSNSRRAPRNADRRGLISLPTTCATTWPLSSPPRLRSDQLRLPPSTRTPSLRLLLWTPLFRPPRLQRTPTTPPPPPRPLALRRPPRMRRRRLQARNWKRASSLRPRALPDGSASGLLASYTPTAWPTPKGCNIASWPCSNNVVLHLRPRPAYRASTARPGEHCPRPTTSRRSPPRTPRPTLPHRRPLRRPPWPSLLPPSAARQRPGVPPLPRRPPAPARGRGRGIPARTGGGTRTDARPPDATTTTAAAPTLRPDAARLGPADTSPRRGPSRGSAGTVHPLTAGTMPAHLAATARRPSPPRRTPSRCPAAGRPHRLSPAGLLRRDARHRTRSTSAAPRRPAPGWTRARIASCTTRGRRPPRSALP